MLTVRDRSEEEENESYKRTETEDDTNSHRGINYLEAQARLLFGIHETSPIILIGKPAPALQ